MDVSVDNDEMKKEHRQKTAMPLLWIGIVSIVMVFGALTSAVVVSKGSREWFEFEMPSTFLISTIVIFLSSITYWLAFRAAKRNELNVLKNFVLLTLILGITFAVFQFISYDILVAQNLHFVEKAEKISASYLYVLSGVHLAHLVGGIISLVIVYFNARRSVYNSENLLGLQLSTTYWHFLGGLWIYLYLFLRFYAL